MSLILPFAIITPLNPLWSSHSFLSSVLTDTAAIPSSYFLSYSFAVAFLFFNMWIISHQYPVQAHTWNKTRGSFLQLPSNQKPYILYNLWYRSDEYVKGEKECWWCKKLELGKKWWAQSGELAFNRSKKSLKLCHERERKRWLRVWWMESRFPGHA